MQYYRCKCGKAEAWTSMGVSKCSKCGDCGSDLAQGADSHREPVDHNFVASGEVETIDGMKPKPLICEYCHRTKAKLGAK